MSDVNHSITPSVTPAKVTFTDCMDLLRKDIFLSLNCHAVATIQSFSAPEQKTDPQSGARYWTAATARASVNYKKSIYQRNPETNLYSTVLADYPLLVSCPVLFVGGGAGALTFPVAQGDECLVLFNDRDLDNWFQGNPTAPNATSRMHAFGDAVLLVGLKNNRNGQENFDAARVMLRGMSDGSFYLALNPANGKAQLVNSSQNLADVLQDILAHVKAVASHAQAVASACASLTVTVPITGPAGTTPSSVPVNASTFSSEASNLGSDATDLTNDASHLGELLE